MRVTKEISAKLVQSMVVSNAVKIAAEKGIDLATAIDFIRRNIEKHIIK